MQLDLYATTGETIHLPTDVSWRHLQRRADVGHHPSNKKNLSCHLVIITGGLKLPRIFTVNTGTEMIIGTLFVYKYIRHHSGLKDLVASSAILNSSPNLLRSVL